MCNGKQKYARGFTVVEVLVAVLILGLSLAGVSIAIGGHLNNAHALKQRTYASWIGQNRIIEIRAAGTTPEVGVTSGEVEYAKAEWAWRAVVSETGVENLYRIDVAVSEPGADDPIRSVTGFVGEPVVPGQSNRVWISGTGDVGNNAGNTDENGESDESDDGVRR